MQAQRRARGSRLVSGLCLFLATAACDDPGVVAPGDEAPLFAIHEGGPSEADAIEDFGLLPGASIHGASLTRNANGAHVRMAATVPAPNTATVWGVVFNAPDRCATTPCGIPDLENPAAQPSLERVGGRVTGGDRVSITGHVREGDTSEVLFGPGLLDVDAAELHFILRVHGPALPTRTDDQIHTFAGGCHIHECLDVGAAIFLSPTG